MCLRNEKDEVIDIPARSEAVEELATAQVADCSHEEKDVKLDNLNLAPRKEETEVPSVTESTCDSTENVLIAEMNPKIDEMEAEVENNKTEQESVGPGEPENDMEETVGSFGCNISEKEACAVQLENNLSGNFREAAKEPPKEETYNLKEAKEVLEEDNVKLDLKEEMTPDSVSMMAVNEDLKDQKTNCLELRGNKVCSVQDTEPSCTMTIEETTSVVRNRHEREKRIAAEKEEEQEKERERFVDKERERKLEREGEHGKEKERLIEKEREREIEREREQEKERVRKLEAERERDKVREREQEKERVRKWEEEKEREKVREREQEKERVRKLEEEKEREKVREREHEKERARKFEEERERERDREREQEKERAKKLDEEREREKERERKIERERELEKEWASKLEQEREREREREKDRLAVERATREAHERAFVAARQRAASEAREKAERLNTEAFERTLSEKASREARLRAERAAVERATAEARERAIEKAMAEKAAADARERMERFSSSFKEHKTSNQDISRDAPLQRAYSSSFQKSSDSNNQGETESALRRKARLERHQRTVERAAKALAEKNTRDLMAQREQAERNRLAEFLDADVKRWSSGKEGNLRALLSTLQYILGPDSGWQPIPLTDVITAAAAKKAYRKATLCVHPDKVQQRGASIQQKYICEKVFDLLKEAWNRFNSEER
uniref:Auxilin-like protein 1 n=1 Tax=Ananas comosus var. bracteatus TaxID=296719 RepID=A0A6V7PU35_ANACO|nr:unnamed protein product [Ananas comosus var. bracteatus]